MSEHFEIISKFRVKRDNPEFSITSSESDRRFVARMCIKAGDIGHSALPWDLHTRWSVLVMKEFFLQGDEERRLNLPMGALCDRNMINDVGKSQKGFLDFVCAPLFEELSKFEAPNYDDDNPNEPIPRVMRTVTEDAARYQSCRTLSHQSSDEEWQVRRCCVQTLKDNAKQWIEDAQASERVLAELKQPSGETSRFLKRRSSENSPKELPKLEV